MTDLTQFKLSLVEQSLATLWIFTETEGGCLSFVDNMHDMAEAYKDTPCAYEAVQFCRDLAFTKHQIMVLRDNQRAWAGEL